MNKNQETYNELITIGELSTKTGVNTVTLRAWERRYGLLKPTRTPKGHRLYNTSDIDHVMTVLAWLNKGIAVSQVKSLLDTTNTQTEAKPNNGIWQTHRQDFHTASLTFNEQKVDAVFNQLNKQYPFETLMNLCFVPLFESIETAPSIKAEHYFLSKCLKQRLTLMLMRYAKTRKKNSENMPVVVFFSLTQESSWKMWLAAIWLADKGCIVDVYEDLIDIKTANECAKQLSLKLKSCTCVCFSQGQHKTIKKAVVDDYKDMDYLTGADFWLNKSELHDPLFTGEISYQPIDVAQDIYKNISKQLESSK
jgi:DNA-binding transcriptional MerR regulator